MRSFALMIIPLLSTLALFAPACGPEVVRSDGDETGGRAGAGRSNKGGSQNDGKGGSDDSALGGKPNGSGGAAAGKGGSASGGSAKGGDSTGGSPGTGGVAVPASPSCSETGAWKTTEQYGQNAYDLGKGVSYSLRNNFWNQGANGAGQQTLWGTSSRCWGVHAKHTDAEPKGSVKGYPDIARGWTLGNQNGANGLAVQVSSLTKATLRWKMTAPTTGRAWALWDIYFHESKSASTGSTLAPVNLMIQQRIVDTSGWMMQDSGSWNKVNIGGIPFREKLETGSTVSSTRNRIQLYVNSANGNVLGKDDMLIDLKAIVDHYVDGGQIKSGDWLTSIQAGYEIVEGGDFTTNDFWTALNDEAWPN